MDEALAGAGGKYLVGHTDDALHFISATQFGILCMYVEISKSGYCCVKGKIFKRLKLVRTVCTGSIEIA